MNDKYKWYEEELKDATLEVLHNDDFCKAFRLRKYPDRLDMSTIILFTCNQIILTGDLRITRHGLASDFGYGLEWFAEQLDPEYLAEKFLTESWHKELAIEWWKDVLAEHRREEAEQLEAVQQELQEVCEFPHNQNAWSVAGDIIHKGTLCDALEVFIKHLEDDSDIDPRWVYENQPAYLASNMSAHLRAAGYTVYFSGEDGYGGYGYAPAEVGWLHAIQARFAALYKPEQEAIDE